MVVVSLNAEMLKKSKVKKLVIIPHVASGKGDPVVLSVIRGSVLSSRLPVSLCSVVGITTVNGELALSVVWTIVIFLGSVVSSAVVASRPILRGSAVGILVDSAAFEARNKYVKIGLNFIKLGMV